MVLAKVNSLILTFNGGTGIHNKTTRQ